MRAKHHGLHVGGRDLQPLPDERPQARAIQNAGHPHDALPGKSAALQGQGDHGVERVGDDEEDRLGGFARDALTDRPDDVRVGD